MSPSNAYYNYMFRKNLVSEVQKLARELVRIPTEEARILADLSRSRFSQEGASLGPSEFRTEGNGQDSAVLLERVSQSVNAAEALSI